MSRADLAGRTAQLRSGRTPFVLATVVRVERPTSAKPGDAALVLPDGSVEGFVGGSCAESTVRSHGLRLLRTGESTLLRITPAATVSGPTPAGPDPAGPDRDGPVTAGLDLDSLVQAGGATEGLVTVANPCLSGGTLEIFLEATIPPTLVHVFGAAPLARALARLGEAIGYEVTTSAAAQASIAADTQVVIVASHGRDEEPVLVRALAARVPYVALVASRRRGAAVLARLAELGVPASDRARVHTPAGLDIGARTAPEIALSILAEVVASRPRDQRVQLPAAAEEPGPCCHP